MTISSKTRFEMVINKELNTLIVKLMKAFYIL